MTGRLIGRRALMLGAGAAALTAPAASAAAGTIALTWDDLIPGGPNPLDQTLQDLGMSAAARMIGLFGDDYYEAVTTDYNGKRVRIPGFMVPMAFGSGGVRDFLLVPYVGACIHVPPPPPNQIILAAAEEPYPVTGYFEAIHVEGALQTETVSTELADVGYVIASARITPYD